MAYIAPPFTPSVSIAGTDLIKDTDEKLQTIVNEAVDYVETQSQAIGDDLQGQFDDLEDSLMLVNPDGTYYTKAAVDAKVATKVAKITSVDNQVVRFNGTTGEVQGSGVVVDDNGNVGIGTSSPIDKLHIAGRVRSVNTATPMITSGVTSGYVSGIKDFLLNNMYFDGTNFINVNQYSSFSGIGFEHAGNNSADMRFYTSEYSNSSSSESKGTSISSYEKMRLDSRGNLGIGVTPSAWNSTYKALEIANGTTLYSSGVSAAFCSNVYVNSSSQSVYKLSTYATMLHTDSGVFRWYTAPSGTAGNAITWTSVMALEADGDLKVPRMYSQTTASAANCFVDSAGQIFRSTSARKYKTDIEDLEDSYAQSFLENARPIYYKSLSENDQSAWGYWGFIAEEIAEFDKRLVHWSQPTKEIKVEKTREIEAIEEQLDEDGNVIVEAKEATIETYTDTEVVPDLDKPLEAEGVQYERITVLLTKIVQTQQKTINDLIARIEALEAK